MFVSDFMHLPTLNVPDAMIPLFTGKFVCHPPDKVENWEWAQQLGVPANYEDFGAIIGALRPFFPTGFGRVPRNPEQAFHSKYKAEEGLNLLYVAGPMAF
jgi:hypothetical protein